MRRPRNSTFRSRIAGRAISPSSSRADGLRAALAADLPHRAAAQRGDRLQHARLEAAADATRRSRPCPGLAPSARCTAAAGAWRTPRGSASPVVGDAVADVDDPRLAARTCASAAANALSRSVQPSETRAARNCRAASTFFASAGSGLLEDPVALHVAAGQVERVLGRQRPEQRRDELGLRRAARGVHRGRGVGQDQQVQRLAVGQHVRAASRRPAPGGVSMQHEVAVVAAAVRDQHHVRLPAVDLDHHLEIPRRACIPGR